MTIREALVQAQARLKEAGVDSARLDSELMMEHVLGRPREWLAAHDNEDLADEPLRQFIGLVDRRFERIPLVHLINKREFYGLELYVNENVLTPRVETEKIVEWAIKYAPKNGRLIDVGTGSGALAVAIKKYRPDLEVVASDIDDQILDVAEKNAAKHGVDVNFFTSDLMTGVPDDEPFDVVVTNLPYLQDDADLMPEVRREPAVALFGGKDGLDIYRRFLKQLPVFLADDGYLFTECDPWQHQNLMSEAAKIGLSVIEEDYFILGFSLRPIEPT